MIDVIVYLYWLCTHTHTHTHTHAHARTHTHTCTHTHTRTHVGSHSPSSKLGSGAWSCMLRTRTVTRYHQISHSGETPPSSCTTRSGCPLASRTRAPSTLDTTATHKTTPLTPLNSLGYRCGHQVLIYMYMFMMVSVSNYRNTVYIAVVNQPIRLPKTDTSSAQYHSIGDIYHVCFFLTAFLSTPCVSIPQCVHTHPHTHTHTHTRARTHTHTQVQPYYVKFVDAGDNTVFGSAYNCQGYWTTASWMGTFSVLIGLLLLYLATVFVFSIQTLDRFDDAKDPTITIENLH